MLIMQDTAETVATLHKKYTSLITLGMLKKYKSRKSTSSF
jgi:hypothetical protein